MRRGLLASRDELSGLRERIADRPFDAFYDRLHRRCSLILEAAPITENSWQSLSAQGHPGAAVNAARATQGRILDLLVAHHIEPDRAYHDRAIEELKNLISWSTWVDPSHGDLKADICTAEAAVAAVVGLDWLWEDLTEADRLRVLGAIRKKAVIPYCQSVKDKAWWYDSYQNWNAVINSGCGLAALALSDEEPKAEKAYELAQTGLKRFFDGLGREGGWDEGVGYWGYALRYVLLLNEAAGRVLDDEQLLHRRGMDTTGLFPIYFTPNGHAAGFGDTATVPTHGALYLLVRHFGLKEVAWWLDTYSFGHDIATDGWSAVGLSLLFRPEGMDTPTDPDLKCVKVFNEIGWASVADHWPHPTMYVAAKTGDLSASHSQRDMNAIQLQVDGEMMLAAGGATHPGLATSDPDGQEIVASRHNTIVVGDRDHAIDAQGSIVDAINEPNCRWVACDAQHACGANVHFVRHIVMVVDPAGGGGQAVIVLDEVQNIAAEGVKMFWHTPVKLQMDDSAGVGILEGTQADLHVAFNATQRVHVTHRASGRGGSDGHVICVKAGKMESGLFVSVFSRHKLSRAPAIRQTTNTVRIQIPGAAITFKRRKYHLQLDSVR
ncbi:MAG TPA: hypothetical protein ENH80_11015 [Phycisphaerae bacterium]|nr:hypothetical protein [Phycisphaerae bacterium]HDZ44459.1 hypothetical protein [Phycisphaerae bacterium]